MALGDIRVVQENAQETLDEIVLEITAVSASGGTADDSVTYTKIATDLKSSSAISASDIDWSVAGIRTKTLTAATTFTFSNLQLNKVVTLLLTGDFVITWPTYMNADHLIAGTYTGTALNYIQIHCTNAGSTTEEVWWTIKTVGV